MPLYNNTVPPFAATQGDAGVVIVNNETLGVGNASQRAAIADRSDAGTRPVLVTFTYPTAPASVSYDVQVAWNDNPAEYTKVGNTTNTAGDQITINRAAAGGNHFRFVRVVEQTTPSVAGTVKVQM